MVDQATRNGTAEADRSIARDVSNFACDLVTLAELQAKLFLADFQESKRRVLTPVILLVVGAVMLLACFPVALIGLAWVFMKQAQWTEVPAYFASAAIGAVLAAVLSYAGMKLLGNALAVYRRSANELERNVQWLKLVLTSR